MTLMQLQMHQVHVSNPLDEFIVFFPETMMSVSPESFGKRTEFAFKVTLLQQTGDFIIVISYI